MLKRDRIIVLKSMPFAESDLIIKGLNGQGHQETFIAKSAKKSKKRFSGGVLDPGSFIEVEYRPSSSMHKLQQAWFLKDFHDLRKSYERLQLAFYFLKVIGTVSQEGGAASQEMFHLLGNALIQAEKTKNLEGLKLFFQIKILFLQGVLPKDLIHEFILQNSLEKHESLKMDSYEQFLFAKQAHETLHHYLNV